MCMCTLDCKYVYFVKPKTAYEMRISDWSSDVCSSVLLGRINREMRIGRTIAEFEYSDRQCARRKGDDDERPEIDRLAMQETLQADRQGKQDGAAQPGQGIQPGKMDGRESPCFHHRETRSW